MRRCSGKAVRGVDGGFLQYVSSCSVPLVLLQYKERRKLAYNRCKESIRKHMHLKCFHSCIISSTSDHSVYENPLYFSCFLFFPSCFLSFRLSHIDYKLAFVSFVAKVTDLQGKSGMVRLFDPKDVICESSLHF